uniref:G-protein coupled receptors family 1 profile domain-containing protein n=1 Tax=Ditylenchus dipsaci TaxID=166011 RepID=A0A915E8R4_9BILA
MSELIADFSLSYSIFDIIVGVAMILSSILCLFLNFIIIRAVTQDIELYKLNSYKFMLGLAWADVIQSLLHSITGFCTIFQTTWYPWFNKAMGVLCTPSYVFYATTTIVLSINRLRNQGHVKKKSTVTDVKILIQAFTITSYCTVLNTMWHNYQWFLPDTKEAYMALNFMWIYNAAVNPLVYFAVNVAIRKKAGSFLKISRGNSKLVEDQIANLCLVAAKPSGHQESLEGLEPCTGPPPTGARPDGLHHAVLLAVLVVLKEAHLLAALVALHLLLTLLPSNSKKSILKI